MFDQSVWCQYNMAKRVPPVMPQHARRITALGQRLRVARMARGMTQANLAERVGVDRTTIGKLESGDPGTSLSTVLRVLSALGLERDIDQIAADDKVGAQLAASSLRRPSPRSKRAVAPSASSALPPSGESEAPDRYALRDTNGPPPFEPLPTSPRRPR